MAPKSGEVMLAKLDRIAATHPIKAVRDAAKRDADRFRAEPSS